MVIHLAGAVRGDRSLDAVAPTGDQPGRDGRAARGRDPGRLPADRAQRLAARGARAERRRVDPAVSVRRLTLGGERLRPHVPQPLRQPGGDPAPLVRLRPRTGAEQADPARDHHPARGRQPRAQLRRAPARLRLRRGRRRRLHRGGVRAAGRRPDDRPRPRRADLGPFDRRGDRRGGRPDQGRPLFGELPVRAHEQQIEVDVDEAARVLGWRATTGLERGLEATVAWYRSQLVTADARRPRRTLRSDPRAAARGPRPAGSRRASSPCSRSRGSRRRRPRSGRRG